MLLGNDDPAGAAKSQFPLSIYETNSVVGTLQGGRFVIPPRREQVGSAGPATASFARRRYGASADPASGNCELADIVRQQYPGVRGSEIDVLAKQIVAGVHREVSPRTPKMQRS